MGKLKALRLGIVKGIQHTKEYGQRVTLNKAIDFTISRMKCTSCDHASRSHTRVRPNFAPLVGEQLFKLLKETQDKATGFLDECRFYHCDDCDREESLKGCTI